MITLKEFLDKTRQAYPGVELRFLHPSLFVVCVSNAFSNSDHELHLADFANSTGLTLEVIQHVINRSGVQLILTTEAERKAAFAFLDQPSRPHWIELLANAQRQPVIAQGKGASFVHFYGYKGGQARSTVLCMFARRLANDGYRVLVVDTDLEAPSLPQLLATTVNDLKNTLMGTVMWGLLPEPVNVYARDDGSVDLLAARPSGREFDLDFATFVLNAQLDPAPLAEVLSYDFTSQYDAVLIDHRSGLASSVVPIAAAHPGPLVACMRLDEQSSQGLPFYEALASLSPEMPGLFVTFSLDPDASTTELLQRHGSTIRKSLEPWARLLSSDSLNPVDPADLTSYWITWFHDRSFLHNGLPVVEKISQDNRESLTRIRELTGLATRKTPLPQFVKQHSLSGANSQGAFIRTEKIAQLFQPNTPYTYVFGRKGTGKTRLVSELLKEQGSEPLLVALDATAPVKSNTALVEQMGEVFQSAPEKLWWSLLRAALETESVKAEPESYTKRVQTLMEDFQAGKAADIQPLATAAVAVQQKRKRVFLIDSLETAFPAKLMPAYVTSLFRFLATVQADPSLSNKVTIRLFLRADLAQRYGGQNAEQHFAGRKLDLVWDAQSIFNFVLSRIAALDWFENNFPEPCQRILSRLDDVKAGLLTEEDYQPILLQFFPEKLKGPNLTSLFFLRTYFSDAPGDDERNAAFYPRLFEQFLNFIAVPADLPGSVNIAQKDASGFLNHALITRAHEEAAKRYLDEVSQELDFLLDLDSASKEANSEAVRKLLSSFNGKRTPFRPDSLAEELTRQSAALKIDVIREALDTMLSVGMFEKLQREQDRWRVGRLFKTALGMKFVR